jgi:hypothetical protein
MTLARDDTAHQAQEGYTSNRRKPGVDILLEIVMIDLVVGLNLINQRKEILFPRIGDIFPLLIGQNTYET